MSGSRSYEIVQELNALRQLVTRQVELLEAILAMQGRIEHAIQELVDVAGT